jgi:hypothetical protein
MTAPKDEQFCLEEVLRWRKYPQEKPEMYKSVLGFINGEFRCVMLCANSWDSYGDYCENLDRLTHWQPLPAPPITSLKENYGV